MIWEAVDLKDKLTELLAGSLKAVAERSNVTHSLGRFILSCQDYLGRFLGLLAKLRKATIKLRHVRLSVRPLSAYLKQHGHHPTVFHQI